MQQPVPVNVVQRLRDRSQQPYRRLHPQRLSDLLQRRSLEIVHDQIRRALVFPVIQDLDDIRMIQLRQRLRLPLEPLPDMPEDIRSERPRLNELDRDRPFQPRVERLVDDRHPAAPDFPFDLVPPDRPDSPVAHLSAPSRAHAVF